MVGRLYIPKRITALCKWRFFLALEHGTVYTGVGSALASTFMELHRRGGGIYLLQRSVKMGHIYNTCEIRGLHNSINDNNNTNEFNACPGAICICLRITAQTPTPACLLSSPNQNLICSSQV